MIRISSGWTLFLRIFFPVFYGVFMLTWTIATIKAGDEVSPLFASKLYQISMISFLLIGLLIVRFTVWRLRRMDIENNMIYFTDYFRTFRYSMDSIDTIKSYSIGWMKFLKVSLKEKGSLGKDMIILIEKSIWTSYWNAHPEIHSLMKS